MVSEENDSRQDVTISTARDHERKDALHSCPASGIPEGIWFDTEGNRMLNCMELWLQIQHSFLYAVGPNQYILLP